jgi:hypothetical protein
MSKAVTAENLILASENGPVVLTYAMYPLCLALYRGVEETNATRRELKECKEHPKVWRQCASKHACMRASQLGEHIHPMKTAVEPADVCHFFTLYSCRSKVAARKRGKNLQKRSLSREECVDGKAIVRIASSDSLLEIHKLLM